MADSAAITDTLVQVRDWIQQGRLAEAEACCASLLPFAEEHSEIWSWLGFVYLLQNRLGESESALRQALTIHPANAADWGNLSAAVRGQGRAAEAENFARRALALDESSASHWMNLGVAILDQRRWKDAKVAFGSAVSHEPGDANAWACLAKTERSLGNFVAAQQAYLRSLELSPGNLNAASAYADLLIGNGLAKQAVEILRQVVERLPQSAPAWFAYGIACRIAEHLDEAKIALRRAIALAPTQREFQYELAVTSLTSWAVADAENCVRQILNKNADDSEAWTLLGGIQQSQGNTTAALESFRRASVVGRDPKGHSRYLTTLQYADDAEPEGLLAAHRQWNDCFARRLLPESPSIRKRPPSGTLRLGFVSADFRRHPLGFLALPALEFLDKSRCSVVCYSDSWHADEWTTRFRAAANTWRKASGLTDEELAEQIRKDEIDVLFDLSGHVGGRLLTFARKPAPWQVTWLGYVGTTGMPAMDFLLADRFHVRNDEDQHYTETVLRMPHGYACYGPPEYAPDVGPLPALALSHVTFGCFNNTTKYNPRLIDAWSEILERVPQAKLLLKFGFLSDPEVQRKIGRQFADRGIATERVLLESGATHLELLASYNRVDLALDTQPYSGGLTTCEALWMGVPVITYPGRTFAGRHSVSHLSNSGCEKFIACDLRGYIDLAVEWAERLDDLSSIRAGLRDRMRQSPLCDAPRFAKDFLDCLESAIVKSR